MALGSDIFGHSGERVIGFEWVCFDHNVAGLHVGWHGDGDGRLVTTLHPPSFKFEPNRVWVCGIAR
jgi:hypothetical protein